MQQLHSCTITARLAFNDFPYTVFLATYFVCNIQMQTFYFHELKMIFLMFSVCQKTVLKKMPISFLKPNVFEKLICLLENDKINELLKCIKCFNV